MQLFVNQGLKYCINTLKKETGMTCEIFILGARTIDLLMCVRRILALLSANSRVLISFSLALYLFTCSQMISSTQLKHK